MRTFMSTWAPPLLVAAGLLTLHPAPGRAQTPQGLVLRSSGIVIASVWQGVPAGEISVPPGEVSAGIDVAFLDADSVEFVPSQGNRSLGRSIGNPSLSVSTSLSTWSFSVEGLAEGSTDMTLSLLQSGIPIYTAPPIELHVEPDHAEADGLVLRKGGEIIATVWQGVASGEVSVLPDEMTDSIFVSFLDPDSTEFVPEGPDFSMQGSIGSPALVAYESLGGFAFRVSAGSTEGMTSLTLCLHHVDHCDFTAAPIEVHVEPGHAEADGLVIRRNGATDLILFQGAIHGSLIVPRGALSDTFHVAFLDPDSLEFSVEGDLDFSLQHVLGDATHAAYSQAGPYSFRLQGLAPGPTALELCLHHIDHCDFTASGLPVVVADPVGVEAVPPPARLAALLPPSPNPFNPNLRIRFTASARAPVAIRIHDISGRLVATLLNRSVDPGEHTLVWDGTSESHASVGSGIYFVHLDAAGLRETRKVTLLR
jgi:hypothetical protein